MLKYEDLVGMIAKKTNKIKLGMEGNIATDLQLSHPIQHFKDQPPH